MGGHGGNALVGVRGQVGIHLDHPMVKDLIGIAAPRLPAVITSEEIGAAQRYRSVTG